MRSVNSVLVVGGGTAGLISAIILKKKLDIQIDVVHSKNIGIIGVGEGSTEHWKEFMKYVGIDQYALIKETDATYKSGVMFENWGSKDYLHGIGSPLDSKTGQYHYVYAHQIAKADPQLTPKIFWKNRIDKRFLNNSTAYPFNQFHFNTHKLNDFLIKIAMQLGINIIEDEIKEVNLDSQGYIDNLTGEYFDYKYDFYIDSTGFKRMLITKLGGKWKSYGQYLKMKSAITFQTEDEEEYNLWTLARAMDYGWMFKIPVWGRHGNGYIFDSDYIDATQAQQEVENYLGKKIVVNKQFNFDPGCLEEVWIKNCCAIGVSANFVEPLEASSIGTSIQQSFLLMHRLSKFDNNTITSYNKSVNDIMENIRDFVALHYMTDKDDTMFWKDLKSIEIPNTLKHKLKTWKNKLPIKEDFNEQSDYVLFTDPNFILVMEGLNLFNRESIKDEYARLNPLIRSEAEQIALNHFNIDKNLITFSHKEFLKLVRDNF
jgi:tryptophan halogenase